MLGLVVMAGCSDLQPRSEEIGVEKGGMFSHTTGDCLDGSYEGTVDAEIGAVGSCIVRICCIRVRRIACGVGRSRIGIRICCIRVRRIV